MNGDFWNYLPIKKQIIYLNRYYPIGYVFLRYDFPGEYIIKDYTLTCGKNDSILYDKNWYLLRVEINNADDYDSVCDIHPACFYPSISHWRNKTLSKLGI